MHTSIYIYELARVLHRECIIIQ